MPDVTLRLGQSLLARVAERHGGRGILMIAGQPLVAQLPEHVRPGDVLKLAVRDITAEQVVMQMHEGKESAAALTYESPALGAINFRLGMDDARVVAEVRVAAGAPLELASTAAEALSEALASSTDRAAAVTVAARPGSFDVSA